MSLSGAANVGLINNGTTGAKAEMYQNMSITATMAGETDGGLAFGATLTVRNGDDIDFDTGDLQTNDSGASTSPAADTTANDGVFNSLSDTSFGSIYVSGDFGKLTFDRAGIDNLMDDGSESHDLQYDYSVGALSVSATAAINAPTNAATDKLGDDWSLKVSYTADAATVTVKTDDEGESDTTLAYALNDTIGLSVNYDTDGQTVNSVAKAETIVKATYSAGAMSGHVAWADDKDDAWEFGVGYTAGALTLGATVAENDGTTAAGTEYDVTASYDLGGGMTIKGAANDHGAYYIGTALAF